MKRIVVVALALGVLSAPLAAQGTPRGSGGGRVQAGEGAQQDRAALERRFRENFAAEVKKRLQLTDDQMTKLMAVNQRLDAQRRQHFQEERAARIGLRAELAVADANVNQARVAELLDTVLRLQRARLELVEREQRELAAFLTPLQRARYQAFVDFVQRRMDDMDGRRDGRDGRGGGTRGGGPPGADGRGAKRQPPPPQTPPPSR
jgi:hypothetical protein